MISNGKHLTSQKGTVLVASLAFLLVLTIVSTAAMKKTIVQFKIASNFKNTDMAFQASESGLVTGENIINGLTMIPNTVNQCTNNCNDVIWAQNALHARYGSGTSPWWSTYKIDSAEEFWALYTRSLPATDVVSYVSEQPRFVIEEYGFVPDDLSPNTRAQGVGAYYYRITARGVGGVNEVQEQNSPNHSIVQSIFAKRFN